jgi:hypothetical protein
MARARQRGILRDRIEKRCPEKTRLLACLQLYWKGSGYRDCYRVSCASSHIDRERRRLRRLASLALSYPAKNGSVLAAPTLCRQEQLTAAPAGP